jgi:predicted  nucleic acid-binding Zn-ribbon protein
MDNVRDNLDETSKSLSNTQQKLKSAETENSKLRHSIHELSQLVDRANAMQVHDQSHIQRLSAEIMAVKYENDKFRQEASIFRESLPPIRNDSSAISSTSSQSLLSSLHSFDQEVRDHNQTEVRHKPLTTIANVSQTS